MVGNVWLDEAIDDLTKRNLQIPSEPNLLFVFIFSYLKPNQRFGGGRLPKQTSKQSRTPIALF